MQLPSLFAKSVSFEGVFDHLFPLSGVDFYFKWSKIGLISVIHIDFYFKCQKNRDFSVISRDTVLEK